MADNTNTTSNSSSSYPNYGLPVPASVSINTVVTSQYTIAEMAGATTLGRAWAWGCKQRWVAINLGWL